MNCNNIHVYHYQVYYGPDLEAIVSGLSRQYQYSFSTLHQGGRLPQQNETPRGKSVCLNF